MTDRILRDDFFGPNDALGRGNVPGRRAFGEGWEYRDQNDGGHDGGQMAVGICLGQCPGPNPQPLYPVLLSLQNNIYGSVSGLIVKNLTLLLQPLCLQAFTSAPSMSAAINTYAVTQPHIFCSPFIHSFRRQLVWIDVHVVVLLLRSLGLQKVTTHLPMKGATIKSVSGIISTRTLIEIPVAFLTGGTTFLGSSLSVNPSLSLGLAELPCGHVSMQTVLAIPRVAAIQNVFGNSANPAAHNETASVLNSVTVMARNSGTVAPTSDMLANPTLIPFTYEKPMAHMVDVSYALKLQRGDHETAVNAVKARVWLETDGESITVILTVPTFPWFHPQDCPLLILLLDSINGADWSTFGYLDPADGWVITDAPIEIKDAQSILCLRLPNVKDCLNGPRSKRRLSDALVYSPRAVRLHPDQ
ncbi:hypothetical protein DFH07DRAFT_769591 [Mycena maculata]|uniref:Uncharacterized protein n=1 Tax=Mycena maculata TaxID=230809 RepID=A0AAD7JM58_9AGAR|nr:hypothetical protein DFH07DRAFT_769591 [Mycena maculata]